MRLTDLGSEGTEPTAHQKDVFALKSSNGALRSFESRRYGDDPGRDHCNGRKRGCKGQGRPADSDTADTPHVKSSTVNLLRQDMEHRETIFL